MNFELCPVFKIVIAYYDGKWKRASDIYDGYDLEDAIEYCQRNFTYEFEHKNARIEAIYRERNRHWEEVEEW